MNSTVNKTIQNNTGDRLLQHFTYYNLQVFTGSRAYQKDDDMDPKQKTGHIFLKEI
jgi:hypothetical protein